jgi:RNA polymerase-binding transcription factor DksA
MIKLAWRVGLFQDYHKCTRDMNTPIVQELEQNLSRRRSALLRDMRESPDEKAIVEEEQESELEESAQKDRITRLTSRFQERERQKLREIDAAVDRVVTVREPSPIIQPP